MSDSDPNELANCPDCKEDGFRMCVHALKRIKSRRGLRVSRNVEDWEVSERLRMPLGYRLAHGFAILRGGDL